LSSSEDQFTLSTLLLQTLVQELILRGKDSKHYWTAAFKTESEKWSLPIVTDCVGLDSNLLKVSLSKQAEKSQSLVLKTKKLTNQRNSQKTSLQLLPSLVADKWEKEVTRIKKDKTKMKAIKIKLYPTNAQKQLLNENFRCYDYIYNKTNRLIKDKIFSHENWLPIRDYLVTSRTRKYNPIYKSYNYKIANLHRQKELLEKAFKEGILTQYEYDTGLVLHSEAMEESRESKKIGIKEIPFEDNKEIKLFEKNIHKDIRSSAVKTCTEMYKSAISNLKNGNIKFFNISYKKKSAVRKCIGVPKTTISIKNGKAVICSGKWEELSEFKISVKNARKYNETSIDYDSEIIYQKGIYYLSLVKNAEEPEQNDSDKVCGVDPGLRSFLTVYDKEEITEYNQNRNFFKVLNNKITFLKSKRTKKVRKKQINKIEKKKIDYTNSIHWNTINSLLKKYNTILLGDIKSHSIVKNGCNKSNNQEFNDLKFYVFKQRLIYKASLQGKYVKLVNEFNTSKCCSSCGNLNHCLGSSKVFTCKRCKLNCDRDSNASKNIFLKGLLL